MPLPANFWTTGWLEKICNPDFSGGISITTVIGSDTTIDLTTPLNTVYAVGGRQDSTEDTVLPLDRSTGLFYGKEVGGDEEILSFNFGFSQGCLPHSPLAPLALTTNQLQRWYTPPFIGMQIKFGGDTDDGSAGSNSTASRIYAKVATNRIATFDLWHWQPLTIIGTIAEVLGALFMSLGADPDTDIDQDSFSDAYDGMLAHGTKVYDQPFIWFRAVEGESVGDAIKRIVSHYTCYLTVDLGGKIALKRKFTGLGDNEPVTPATVIGDPAISIPLDLLTNKMVVSYGQWCCYKKNGVTGYDKEFKADPGRTYFEEVTESTSIDLYGERSWNIQTRREMIDGKEVDVPAASYPYYFYEEQKVFGDTRLVHLESKRRSVVKVKQGLLGLDFGVGNKVRDLDVNSNGAQGGVFWCVSQRVDFNNLTVLSTILDEVPQAPP